MLTGNRLFAISVLAILLIGGTRVMAEPFFENGTLVGPSPNMGGPRYVCLARLNNDDLLAVWAGFPANADQAAIWSAYSTDNGKTWSEPILAVDTPDTMDCDPNIIVCTDRVLAVATTRKAAELINTTWPFSTSYDNGRSWQPSGEIHNPHKYNSGKLQAATRLRNGRLLLPYCWDRILEKGGAVAGEPSMISNASVLYSDDDGHTWKPGGDLDISAVQGAQSGINGLDEICLAELIDGSVYALCRTGVQRLYEARSMNRGLTWSKPKPSQLVGHNAPASMVALDEPRGAVVVVWNMTPDNSRKPLAVAYSTDRCHTWSEPKILCEDYSPYPSIVQAADGTSVASWFQRAEGGGTELGIARFNWEWLTSDGR